MSQISNDRINQRPALFVCKKGSNTCSSVCQNANVSIQIKARVDVRNLAKSESFRLVRGEFSTSLAPFFCADDSASLWAVVYYLLCMSPYRAVKGHLWNKWPEQYPAVGQAVIKRLQGDYHWHTPAATAGDGVCVRQNPVCRCNSVRMSTFRAFMRQLWVKFYKAPGGLVCAHLI